VELLVSILPHRARRPPSSHPADSVLRRDQRRRRAVVPPQRLPGCASAVDLALGATARGDPPRAHRGCGSDRRRAGPYARGRAPTRRKAVAALRHRRRPEGAGTGLEDPTRDSGVCRGESDRVAPVGHPDALLPGWRRQRPAALGIRGARRSAAIREPGVAGSYRGTQHTRSLHRWCLCLCSWVRGSGG
jgi:hypothetical protein